ncbi:MAG: glycine zipper 2TM domain-containing protein [Candidatus Hydrogenedentes bacterium]|nr:glycine zipper 2TM domain-containing protein [Candidatus Hydrogenedentota bacterium]
MRMKFAAVAIALATLVGVVGCETTPAQNGALQGGVLGAGAGAIIGNQSHHAGEGALIGGAAGALGGALIGEQNQQGGGTR